MHLNGTIGEGKIVACDVAKRSLPLHIVRQAKAFGKEESINAKAPCKVSKRIALQQSGFIPCRRFGRTLFETKSLRILPTGYMRYSREFVFGALPSLNLPQSKIDIHTGIPITLQCQTGNVIAGMLLNKQFGSSHKGVTK